MNSRLNISSFGETRNGEVLICDHAGGRVFLLAH